MVMRKQRRSWLVCAYSLPLNRVFEIGEVVFQNLPDSSFDRPSERRQQSGRHTSRLEFEFDAYLRATFCRFEPEGRGDLHAHLVMGNGVRAIALIRGDCHFGAVV